jgi:hypothetical protein
VKPGVVLAIFSKRISLGLDLLDDRISTKLHIHLDRIHQAEENLGEIYLKHNI